MKKNIILSVAYQVLKIIVPLITAPYVARVLGNNQIGIYSYTSSIVTYFSIFAGLGTASYGAREIARCRSDRNGVSRIFWEIELLTIFSSVIVLIFWAVWVTCNPQYRGIYIILSFNILSVTFDISWLYNGLEQFKYEIMINSVMKLLGVIFIFTLVKTSNDLVFYIAINSASTLLGSISLWFSAYKLVDLVPVSSLRIFMHLRKTLVYFLPTIAVGLYSYLDKTLIGLFTHGYDENGFYEQATKILTLCNSLTFFPINSVVQSRNSYLFAENRIYEMKNIMGISMSGCMYMGVGVCFGLWSLSGILVPFFFGVGYESVINVLYVFAPLILLTGIGAVYSFQYYNPAGKMNYVTLCITISTIINIGMNIVMIPKYGAVGAAVASLIAEFITVVLYILNCDKCYTIKSLIKCGYRKCAAGSVMMVYLAFLKSWIINQYFSLVLCITTGAAVYTVVLMLLKDDFISDYIVKTIKKNGII